MENLAMDIFISYSRNNKDQMLKLYEALENNNLNCWVDMEDIPPSVEWMNEIKDAIKETNAFIALISMDWIKSLVCIQEFIIAKEHNKRIIPVIVNDVDPKIVPIELAKLNWINFRTENEFEMALKNILKSYKQDIEYVKLHTHLQVQAFEWEKSGKDISRLLRGKKLMEAEHWQETAGIKDPPVTNLQSNFIRDSRLQESILQGKELMDKAKKIRDERPVDIHLATLLSIEALRNNPSNEIKKELYSNLSLCGKQLEEFTIDTELNNISFFSPDLLMCVSNNEQLIWSRNINKYITDEQFKQYITGNLYKHNLKSISNNLPEELAAVFTSLIYNPFNQRYALITNIGKVLIHGSKNYFLDHNEDIKIALFSPRGTYIVTSGKDKLCIWDVATGNSIKKVNLTEINDFRPDIENIAFSQDEKYIGLGHIEAASVLELPTLKIIRTVDHFADFGIDSVKLAISDYEMLATCVNEEVKVWSLKSNNPDVTRYRRKKPIIDVTFTSDGAMLGLAGEDGSVLVWDWKFNKEIQYLPHGINLQKVVFGPGGNLAASSDVQGRIKVWDMKSPWIESCEKPSFTVNEGFAVAPDASVVAYFERWGDADGWRYTVREPGTNKEIARFIYNSPIPVITISSGGKMAAMENHEFGIDHAYPVEVLNVGSGKVLARIYNYYAGSLLRFGWSTHMLAMVHENWLEVMDINRPHKWSVGVYLGYVDQGLKVYSIFNKSALQAGLLIGDIITGMDGMDVKEIDQDKVYNYLIGDKNSILKITVERENINKPFHLTLKRSFKSYGSSIIFQKDKVNDGFPYSSVDLTDNSAIYSSQEKEICVIDLTKGSVRASFPASGRVVAISSNDNLIAFFDQKELCIVSLMEKDFIHKIVLEKEPECMAFSENSKYIVAGMENRVYVWELESAQLVHESQFNFGVQAVAMKPDGSEVLVTNSQPMTAQLRPVSTDALIHKALEYVGRTLTKAEWNEYFSEKPFPYES